MTGAPLPHMPSQTATIMSPPPSGCSLDTTLPQSRERDRPSAALVALLKVLLAARCEQHHVAPRLVASSDDIDRLALDDEADIPALHGWRREVFGNEALRLKQGQIALGAEGKRIKLIPV
jgi:ribonuclease D